MSRVPFVSDPAINSRMHAIKSMFASPDSLEEEEERGGEILVTTFEDVTTDLR